jgi:signal peptidase I
MHSEKPSPLRDPAAARGHVDELGPISAEYDYGSDSHTVDDGAILPTTHETTTKKRHGLGATREIIETLLLALVIFVAVRAVVLNFKVDGTSMDPNLADQEMLLVNRNIYFHFDLNGLLDALPFVERDGERIVYPFHPPERGDIVVFEPPMVSSKPFIKRVIALPGETVTIENGFVYIDGVQLDEPYISGGITECPRSRCEPVVVPEGAVYVLGDNRRNSSDSRSFGTVDVDDIVGKAWVTYWPFSEFGLVPHYDYPEVDG